MGGRAGTAVVLLVGVRMGLSARRVRRERRGPNYHAKSNWRRDEAGLGLLCPVLPLSRPRRRTRPSRMRRADGAEPGPECEVLCDVIMEGAMSRCDRVGEEWVQAHSPSRPAPVYDRVASDLHAGAGFPPAPMLPLQTPHAGMPLHTLAPTQTPPPLPYLFTPAQHVTY